MPKKRNSKNVDRSSKEETIDVIPDDGSETVEDELCFEDALYRLADAVRQLEQGNLSLDESLAQYEGGIRYLGECLRILDAAERKIEILSGFDADGNPVTQEFDDEAMTLEQKADERSRRRSATASQVVNSVNQSNTESSPSARRTRQDAAETASEESPAPKTEAKSTTKATTSVASPSVASPSVASPSVASPSVASPSVASPSVASPSKSRKRPKKNAPSSNSSVADNQKMSALGRTEESLPPGLVAGSDELPSNANSADENPDVDGNGTLF